MSFIYHGRNDDDYAIGWTPPKPPKPPKPKKPLHELRYGGIVYALSDSCENLMYLKAKWTLDKIVQHSEMLHIYFEGKTEWVFDHYIDEKEASRIVACGGEKDV